MTTTQLIAIASSASFALICAAMGIRLLMLFRRTRELPEFFLGAGFVVLLGVALPMLAISGMGRTTVGEIHYGLLAAGLIGLWLGITSLFAFTWRTFRSGEAWALALVVAGSMSIAGVGIGVYHALSSAAPDIGAFEAGGQWTACIRLPIMVFYAWTAIESIYQHAMARRRFALGIGDPVVKNRFLLLSLVGVSQVLVYAINMVMHAYGMGAMNHPASQLVMAGGGFFGSVLMYLTFLPPEAYLRIVRSRASALAS